MTVAELRNITACDSDMGACVHACPFLLSGWGCGAGQVDTFWYLDYVPECKERFRSTLVPTDKMTSIMEGEETIAAARCACI